MSSSKNNWNPKIKTVNDLRLIKAKLKYEVQLQEYALLTGFGNFKLSLKNTANKALKNYGKKLVIFAVLKIIKNKFQRNNTDN